MSEHCRGATGLGKLYVCFFYLPIYLPIYAARMMPTLSTL